MLTRETIFLLLQCHDGAFSFSPKRIRHDRNPSSLLGAEQILMDGLRMVDEWRVLAAELPGEDAVYRVAMTPDLVQEHLKEHFGRDSYSREIAEVLGHRSLQMVKRYSHFLDEHIAAVGDKVAERLFK